MQHLIEDFIAATNNATTHDEVFSLYQRAISGLGLDRAIYTFITDHPGINQKAGHGVKSNYPDDWMEYYWEKGYNSIDPVIMYVMSNAHAFSWEHLAKMPQITSQQKRILDESNAAGLHNGIGIPLYGPKGQLAGTGLGSTHKEKLNLDRNLLCKVKLLTEQFHLVYCSLSVCENAPATKPNLSPRELEILKWWAAGKTASEISMIVNCAAPTVKFHVTNIYNKLEANSKILAVSKAIRMGLLSMDGYTYTDV